MATNEITEPSEQTEAMNSSHINETNGEVHVDRNRERAPTTKFSEWRVDTYQGHFQRAVSSWRRQATQLEKLLSDSKELNVIRTARDVLETKMAEVTKCYDELSAIERCTGIFTKYDNVEQDHYQLAKNISNQIRVIEMEQMETSSKSSSRTISSRKSRHEADVAAKATALQTKLKLMEIEAQKKLELDQQRIELEQKRIELERTQTQREVNTTQAKLDALVELESEDYTSTNLDFPTTDRGELVAEYVQKHSEIPVETETTTTCTLATPMISQLNASAPVFTSVTTPLSVSRNSGTHTLTDAMHHPVWNPLCAPSTNPAYSNRNRTDYQQIVNGESNRSSSDNIADVLKLLTQQMTLSRLPPPEPGIFFGDPLSFPSWKGAFQTLVANKGIPLNERIYYLSKYLGGQAKECVEGFLLLTTDEAYSEAMNLLEQRYGDPFEVANGFCKKLDSWPKIPPRDGNALRKFSDFLKQCEIAMLSINSLRVLDDDQENRKILMKLPDWLTLSWGRVVSGWRERQHEFPPFSEFVKFIAKEAKITCDPVTSLQSLKPNTKNSDGTTPSMNSNFDKRRSVGRSYATQSKGALNTGGDMQRKSCTFCEKSHNIDDCYAFLAKDLQDRKEFAKRKGLCFGCMVHGHRSKDCNHRLKCKTCSKQHPTCLHGDMKKPAKTIVDEAATHVALSHAGVSHRNDFEKTCKCSMIVPVWLSHSDRPDKELLVYALLDTQSDTTFVLDTTCDDLDIDGPNVDLLLSTMTAENQVVKGRKLDGLMVRGHNSQLRISLPTTYSRELMPSNRAHIPTPNIARKWAHLQRIADELMPLSDAPVGLLIGYNCSRALAPRDVIAPVGDEPFAQRTDLGWGIVGVVHPDESDGNDPIGVSHHLLVQGDVTSDNAMSADYFQITLQTKIKESITPLEVAHMMEMDFNERCSDERGPSLDDLRFLKLMKEGIHRTDDEHYEMPLPLKEPKHMFPNNRNIAMRLLRQLESKFHRDPKYRDDYWTFMQKMISDGYAERVPKDELQCEDGLTWYIPHHGVYHSKKPNKIRVVFDCSAKCRGESLNDNLLQGPDLMNKLVGVLCRFRQEKVGLICDIEQIFFQFRVDQRHRNLLRFLWWDIDDPGCKPLEYRMKVHLFGAASSPACANFGLKQAALDFEEEFGSNAANFLKSDFYVDDGLKSVATVDDAIELITNSRAMCQKGGLRLHKFISNQREVISSIPIEDRIQKIQDIDLGHDELPIERALGVFWCVQSDAFKFRITLQDRPLTRRGILSTISSIYDPLGFLAPVLLIGKQILQQLCKDKVDWDTKLPDDLKLHWEQWRSSLSLLETFEVSRCFKPTNFGDIKTAQLHYFSDASTSGYGQCTYIRLVDDTDQVHCSLVSGKARVTPLKTVTIPRLELTAALVSVRVSTFLERELEYCNITNIFWTDSKIVLGYVSNDSRRFHVFVSNRVQQIRNHTNPDQWRYVKTEENPTDEGSRGLSVQDFLSKSMWTKGPAFLWEKEIQPATTNDEALELQPYDPEVKQAKILATHVQTPHSTPFLNRLDRFSNWISARRAIAVCLRLAIKHPPGIDQRKPNQKYRACNVDELSKAETIIIRRLQECEFKDELDTLRASSKTCDQNKAPSRRKSIKKSSPLHRLDPYLDNHGVLRVGGRIKLSKCTDKLKNPVILPKRHHITKLIIRHIHEEVQHQGRGITVNAIRNSGYWIPACGSEVYYYISQCVKCRKFRSRVQEQKMADLPEDRVNPAPPFSYCGVDCFGPWYVKEGRKEVKRYGALFTCLASRAIHIETVNSMTTDSFINSLRRLLAVRGPICQLRSDQGTNFVGAANELNSALNELDHDRIRNFLLPQNCDYFDFKMNTPSASHMGGAWERQIRTVRNVLTSLLDQSGRQLDDESSNHR